MLALARDVWYNIIKKREAGTSQNGKEVRKMITDYKKNTKYFQFTNPHPKGKEIGDCHVRSIAIALGITWIEAYDMLCKKGREILSVIDTVETVSGVLKEHGFREMKLAVKKGKKRKTLIDLIKENPDSVIVGQIAHHWATARDNKVRDTWNSSEKPLYKYWIK